MVFHLLLKDGHSVHPEALRQVSTENKMTATSLKCPNFFEIGRSDSWGEYANQLPTSADFLKIRLHDFRILYISVL